MEFHVGQNRGERNLHLVEELSQSVCLEPGGEQGNEPPRGPTGGQSIGGIDGILQPRLADIGLNGVEIGGGADGIEIGLGPERMVALAGIEQISGEERVERHPA